MARIGRPAAGHRHGPGVGDLADWQIGSPNKPTLTPAQQRALDDALAACKRAYSFSNANAYSYAALQAVLALANLLGFEEEEGAPWR